MEPGVFPVRIDSNPVNTEVNILEWIVGEERLSDDTDGDSDDTEFLRLEFRTTRVTGCGPDCGIDYRMPELIVTPICPCTSTETTPPPGGLKSHQCTSSRVERISHASWLLSLASRYECIHRLTPQFNCPDPIIVS
jgi:hypothetical protein